MPGPHLPPDNPTAAPPRIRRGAYARHADAYADEIRLMRDLLERQRIYQEAHPEIPIGFAYLAMHMEPLTLQRTLANIDLILPFIRGRVLEWGCCYARDSCLFRKRLGEAVELHGTDVFPSGHNEPFRDYSGMEYRQLHHPFRLDYPDSHFDTVTSTGVLEHVPDDLNSLREIHRILKPGGHFVVTFLPNRYSYTEALQRWRGISGHDRLYSMRQIRRMLNDNGFDVVDDWYYLMVPTILSGFPARLRAAWNRRGRQVWAANRVLERIAPLNRIASNLSVIGRKRVG